MTSVYNSEGLFLGRAVTSLSEGPTKACNPKREPYGTMGQYFPSQALDEFQRDMANAKPVYGLRTVFHEEFGRVEQALVAGIGGDLIWING